MQCSPKIKEYLSRRHSRGDKERKGGKYKHHADSAFDIDFFVRILRDKSLNAVVPKSRLRYRIADNFTVMNTTSRKAESIRAGLMMFNRSGDIRLFVAQGTEGELEEYRQRGFRYAVANFGLYYDVNMGIGKVGHANGLVFDLQRRRIERYEPLGSMRCPVAEDGQVLDKQLARLFRKQFLGWTYKGIDSAPLFGPQLRGDIHQGSCVTWSAFLVLNRLLNPQLSMKEVYECAGDGTPEELRRRIKRFQRFMIDTLRA
jgi:hypothetical protein